MQVLCKSVFWMLFWCPVFLHSVVSAQSELTLEAGSLDFYRIQAFVAPTPEQRLKLNHIGILGMESEAGFLISAVLEGYPAARAGLVRGDVIIASNNENFHPVYSFNENSIGDRASPAFTENLAVYDLSVSRADNRFEISVIPVFENFFDSLNSANLNSIQQFSAGNKIIGYVHFWALSRNSNDLISYHQLVDALALCDGIILDLRSSFGFFDQDQLNLFQTIEPRLNITAASNWLASWQQSNHSLDFEAYRKPVVILIDEYTSGGAEILALELAKAERIVTLGSNTTGKIGGYEFVGEASLQYQPNLETLIDGIQFENVGLEVEYELTYPAQESRRDDPQFNESINLLLGII